MKMETLENMEPWTKMKNGHMKMEKLENTQKTYTHETWKMEKTNKSNIGNMEHGNIGRRN